jgi:hypothetical protein
MSPRLFLFQRHRETCHQSPDFVGDLEASFGELLLAGVSLDAEQLGFNLPQRGSRNKGVLPEFGGMVSLVAFR